LCSWLALGSAAVTQGVVSATYGGPIGLYPHAALGDDVERAALRIGTNDGEWLSTTWDRPLVFEDTAPRLVDLDDDELSQILAVEAHESLGLRCGERMAAA
jgi:hypothetical protein